MNGWCYNVRLVLGVLGGAEECTIEDQEWRESVRTHKVFEYANNALPDAPHGVRIATELCSAFYA